MCGIVGMTHVNEQFLKNAMKRIKHRGPDA